MARRSSLTSQTEPARNNVAHWYWSLEQDRQQLGWFERSFPPGQLALPFHRTRARKPWADESLADYYLNIKQAKGKQKA